MFDFFNKNKKITEVYAPVEGYFNRLETASDPVFKAKIMGEGFYVLPTTNKVFSPLEGKIDSIFPTKHAFTIKTKDGINVLIHIGSDTVQLEGVPFNLNVSPGDQVKPGDLLATVDFEYIQNHGKGIEVFVVFPELDESKKVSLVDKNTVTIKDIVATI